MREEGKINIFLLFEQIKHAPLCLCSTENTFTMFCFAETTVTRGEPIFTQLLLCRKDSVFTENFAINLDFSLGSKDCYGHDKKKPFHLCILIG